MYYLASKLLTFLLHPFNWIFALLLFSVMIRSGRLKKRIRIFSLFLFIVFGNRALINTVYQRIEPQPLLQETITAPFEYGVVLGGGFAGLNKRLPDRIQFNDHINRLTEGMELMGSGKLDKLILSGGEGGLQRDKEAESLHSLSFLKEINWPDSIILTETTSRNTYENARNVKHMLDSLGAEAPGAKAPGAKAPILLITSALHMPRAAACFRQQGISFTPYPADYQQWDKVPFPQYFFPQLRCFDEWQAIFREWVGMAVYRLKGYAE